MSAEELQSWNWAINGCVRRLISVCFSYSFREVSKVACNFGEKRLRAVGVVSKLDMARSTKRGLRSVWCWHKCW